MTKDGSDPSLFLSYAHENQEIADHFKKALETQGITVLIDKEVIAPGNLDWEDAIRMAIDSADAFLLLASPSARKSLYVRDEIHIARELSHRTIYPVWIEGEHWIDCVPLGMGSTQYIDARQSNYSQAISDFVEILRGASHSGSMSIEDNSPPLLRNPYKGLRSFTEADAHDFFGRFTLITWLTTTLKKTLADDSKHEHLLAVVGPSGSGKSSVVLAGLLPALRQSNPECVYLEPMTPGETPLTNLQAILQKQLGGTNLATTIEEMLKRVDAQGLGLCARTLTSSSQNKVVLIIDQFEELFTLTAKESDRRHFIHLLTNAMREPQGSLIVVLTLRADFYDRPMRYQEFAQLLFKHQQIVFPMTITELREAIEVPARNTGLTFEKDLVNDLLFEMIGQSNALPLLQFTLDQLYQNRDGRQLTRQAYQKLGGIHGALLQQAEKTYNDLSSNEHRDLARRLFLRLISPGLTELDTTRRRASLTEFQLADPSQTQQMQEVCERFINARLLTTNQIKTTTTTEVSHEAVIQKRDLLIRWLQKARRAIRFRQLATNQIIDLTATIEVSHEAVIQKWARLNDWLKEARRDIRLQETLRNDVVEWEQKNKRSDRLYRGNQLKEVRGWEKRNIPSKPEKEFLRSSVNHWRVRVAGTFFISLVLLIAVGGLVFSFTHRPPTPPDPTLVTTLNDNGTGSLRWCIVNAPSGSRIRFASRIQGTIKLTSNDISIDKQLTIQGPGANFLAISSTGPIIDISPRATVSISNLTFKNGVFTNTSFIVSKGTLTITNSVFSNNRAQRNALAQDYGSSITNGGNLFVTNSTFSNNSSELGGGAIDSNSIGVVTITNSTFSNNSSPYYGGAIYSSNLVIVIGCTFLSNQAPDGGAIDGGDLTIVNSTFLDNQAESGGAIDDYNGNATIVYSTLYGNSASSKGGAIWIDMGIGELRTSTNMMIATSILVANQAPTGPNIAGTLTTGGYNLIQNTAGATFLDPYRLHATDKEVPQLSDLKIASQLSNDDKVQKTLANGGHTQTLKLQQGSPALNTIPFNGCYVIIKDASGKNLTITTDQLGHSRLNPSENSCDAGAYELS